MTTLIETDVAGYENLATQLIEKRSHKVSVPEAKMEASEMPSKEDVKEESTSEQSTSRRSTFRKGDENFDIDDDAEIEFTADKQSVKMKLSELKDRAAGDVAVKNRMHSLAEEKKRVQGTLKEFSRIAEKDPLEALKYISKQVKEAGTDFEYDKYISALAGQAEKLSRMSEPERRAHQAEKKLEEVEGDLSQKEIEDIVRLKAQDSRASLGIEESHFNRAAQMVMENDVLMESVETEDDFFQTVEEVVIKSQNQKRIERLVGKVDPEEMNNKALIIEMSDIVERLLPDGTDKDLQDIIEEVLKPKTKLKAETRLSEKQRRSMPLEQMKAQGASDVHLLMEQLKEKRPDNSQRRYG